MNKHDIMPTHVKHFTGFGSDTGEGSLEYKIQKWLTSRTEGIEIFDIKYAQSENNVGDCHHSVIVYSALIFYQDHLE
jgi:hypothetical protein